MNRSLAFILLAFGILGTSSPRISAQDPANLQNGGDQVSPRLFDGSWANRPFNGGSSVSHTVPGEANWPVAQPATGQVGDQDESPIPQPQFQIDTVQYQAPPNPADSMDNYGSYFQSPYFDPGEFPIYPDQQGSRNRVRGCVGFDSCLTREMLDFQNRQTDKSLTLLSHRSGDCFPELIIGGQMRSSFLAASTNTANKYSYLGRFPPDFVGTSATDARLLHANMSGTAHFTKFAHGQFELLFSDVFSFPTFKQGSLQVRQAYIAIGDFETSPYYAFIGKHNISFGDMRTLSPFSQSVVWHYFGGLAEGVGAGVNSGNWNWTATAINGGRGIRVVDSQAIGQLNNFAANGTWRLPLGNCNSLQLGGGYLHGTIYDAATAEHTNTALFGQRNPAWDVNAHLNAGLWQFSGEFASTVKLWPVTGHEVAAWRGETARDICVFGLPGRLSASFSEGIQGDRGTEFEFNRQLVLGLGVYPTINTQVTFEYVQSTGFAPLIDITTVSDRDVIQDSFVLGMVFVL